MSLGYLGWSPPHRLLHDCMPSMAMFKLSFKKWPELAFEPIGMDCFVENTMKNCSAAHLKNFQSGDASGTQPELLRRLRVSKQATGVPLKATRTLGSERD